MTLDILSGPKGSNPGGLCTVSDSRGKKILDAYFKYCYGSQLSRDSPFKAENQPILEVLSSLLAKTMGLETAQTYVLDNRKGDARFIRHSEDQKDPVGKKFYFISKLETNPSSPIIDSQLSKIVDKERIYLDSLLLGDYDRRANQTYKEGRAVYIDLGCMRFVCANEGFLKSRTNIKLLPDKDFKVLKGRLGRYNISNALEDNVNLGEIIESVPNYFIPILNSYDKPKVRDLITEEECYHIQNYLAQSLEHSRKKFKEAGLILF